MIPEQLHWKKKFNGISNGYSNRHDHQQIITCTIVGTKLDSAIFCWKKKEPKLCKTPWTVNSWVLETVFMSWINSIVCEHTSKGAKHNGDFGKLSDA